MLPIPISPVTRAAAPAAQRASGHEVGGQLGAEVEGRPAGRLVHRRFDGQVGGAGAERAAQEPGGAVAGRGQRGRHADVDDGHRRAGRPGQHVDGRAAGDEVGHHLGGDLLRPRGHALGHHAVIGGEDHDGRRRRHRRRAHPGDPGQLHAQRPPAVPTPPGASSAGPGGPAPRPWRPRRAVAPPPPPARRTLRHAERYRPSGPVRSGAAFLRCPRPIRRNAEGAAWPPASIVVHPPGQKNAGGQVGGRAGWIVPVTSPRVRRPPSAAGAVAEIVTVSPSSRKVRVEPSASVRGSAPFQESSMQRAPLVGCRARHRPRGVEVAGAEGGAVDRQVGQHLVGRPVRGWRTGDGTPPRR